MKKLIDRHRDIQYTLTNIEPDLWSWSFEINGKIKQGTTRAARPACAAAGLHADRSRIEERGTRQAEEA